MAGTPNSVITPQTLNVNSVEFTSSTGTVAQALFTAAANGSVLHAITAAGTHTTNRKLSLYLKTGSTSRLLGTIIVAAKAGSDGVVAQNNVFNGLDLPGLFHDSAGNLYMQLAAGWSVTCVLDANCDAGKVLHVIALGEDY